jgi:hypothetical protein
MRNLLALIGAVVVGFAVIGWYCGWYQLGISKTTDGNLHVETRIHTRKVVDDSGHALKKAGELVGTQLDKTSQDGSQPTPGATPGPQDQPRVSIFGFDLSPPAKK